MANWCFNTVRFRGEPEQLKKVTFLFLNLQVRQIIEEKGQLPDFVKGDSGHLFDLQMENGELEFCTQWTPNPEVMAQVADYFQLDFTQDYSETANGIYGQFVYEKGVLRDICLEIEDFARYSYDEDKERYLFEGDYYEDDNEILQILLERRRLQNLGNGNQ
jgi:hypothetical protein